jgi:uncharacterized membrane protein HdeD (DUF308 family)
MGMTASLATGAEVAGPLPLHQISAVQSYIPNPGENHHLFGAAFLLLGVLLVVEALAGRVWHRNRWRTAIWPTTIMYLGIGMIVVTALDTSQRPIHFTIGMIMLVAGWMEFRYRLGEVSRRSADMFVIPALIAGALEIGVFHFHGTFNNAGTVHVLLGITTAVMVAVRLLQSRQPLSMPRHAFMGVMAVALALELLALNH